MSDAFELSRRTLIVGEVSRHTAALSFRHIPLAQVHEHIFERLSSFASPEFSSFSGQAKPSVIYHTDPV